MSATGDGTERYEESGLPVVLPSGSTLLVLTDGEVDYLTERVDRYLNDNLFTNVTDLQDIDRLLTLEMLSHRFGGWISLRRDYMGEQIDEAGLRRDVAAFSREIRMLKAQLGLDKASRDRSRGEDSIPVFIENILRRAKEFGVMREEQLTRALTLAMELIALYTWHMKCDEAEQRNLGITRDDLMSWIEEVFIPEFQSIDAYFREHSQRFWIRSM